MPLVDWDLESTWRLVYRAVVRDSESPLHGQAVTYGREYASRFYSPLGGEGHDHWKKRFDRLSDKLSDSRVLVVGCGFGFLLEELIDAGLEKVWGIDSSQWIHDNLQAQGREDTRDRVLDLDLLDPNLSSLLSDATGGSTFRYIITEEVLSSYSDDEIPALLDACEPLVSSGGSNPYRRIVHVVNERGVGFNTKPLETWKTMRDSHTWIRAS